MSIVLILCVCGLAFSPYLDFNFQKLECASYLFVNEALYGTDPYFHKDLPQNQTWVGAVKALKSAESLISYVNTTQADVLRTLNTPIGDFKVKNTIEENVTPVVNNVIGNIAGAIGDFLGTGDIVKKVTEPVFGFLDQIDWYKDYATGIINSLKSTVTGLLNETLVSETNKALDQVREFRDAAEKYRENLYKYMGTGEKSIKFTRDALIVYFAISSVISCVFIVILACFIVMRNYPNLRKHKIWLIFQICFVILTLATLCGLIYTTFLFPVAVAGAESCQILTIDALHNKSGYMTPELWDKAKVCLIGDGNIAKAYDLDEKLNQAKTIVQTVESVKNTYDSTINSIQSLWNSGNNQEKGKNITDNIHFKDPLILFSESNCKKDVAVWNISDCPRNMQVLLINNINASEAHCVPINDFSINNMGNIFEQRYQSCPEAANAIKLIIENANKVQPLLSKQELTLNNANISSAGIPNITESVFFTIV